MNITTGLKRACMGRDLPRGKTEFAQQWTNSSRWRWCFVVQRLRIMKPVALHVFATVLLVAVALTTARRPYQGASGPDDTETEYNLVRGTNRRIINLPPGEDPRERHILTKMEGRLQEKQGENQLNRRRRGVPQSDDSFDD